MGLAVRVCVVVGLWWVCIGGSASLELALCSHAGSLAGSLGLWPGLWLWGSVWGSRTDRNSMRAGGARYRDMRSSLRALSGVLVMIGT